MSAAKLLRLTSVEFENLIYDLCVASGLQNAKWRTPGSDVGRDIEGDFAISDFSGYLQPQRWYIECKRYKGSVDWPTVRDKLSYAEAHDADFLLIATTATLSPQAIDQLNLWNEKHTKPKIRSWSGHEISNLITLHPVISAKYRLGANKPLAETVLFPLAFTTLKFVDAAYSSAIFSGTNIESLEAAAALTDLTFRRFGSVEAKTEWAAEPTRAEDIYDWCQAKLDVIRRFDRYGLRAFLAVLRTMTSEKTYQPETIPNGIRIVLPDELSEGQRSELNSITIFGNFEISFESESIAIVERRT